MFHSSAIPPSFIVIFVSEIMLRVFHTFKPEGCALATKGNISENSPRRRCSALNRCNFDLVIDSARALTAYHESLAHVNQTLSTFQLNKKEIKTFCFIKSYIVRGVYLQIDPMNMLRIQFLLSLRSELVNRFYSWKFCLKLSHIQIFIILLSTIENWFKTMFTYLKDIGHWTFWRRKYC